MVKRSVYVKQYMWTQSVSIEQTRHKANEYENDLLIWAIHLGFLMAFIDGKGIKNDNDIPSKTS